MSVFIRVNVVCVCVCLLRVCSDCCVCSHCVLCTFVSWVYVYVRVCVCVYVTMTGSWLSVGKSFKPQPPAAAAVSAGSQPFSATVAAAAATGRDDTPAGPRVADVRHVVAVAKAVKASSSLQISSSSSSSSSASDDGCGSGNGSSKRRTSALRGSGDDEPPSKHRRRQKQASGMRKHKHKRKHKDKHKRNDGGDPKNDTAVVPYVSGGRGVFDVDASPDFESVGYGTVLDAPRYDVPGVAVSVRHLLGLKDVPSYERPWLTSGSRTQSAAAIARRRATTEVAGVAPARQPSSKKKRSAAAVAKVAGRYFTAGAVPKRPVLNIALSRRRRMHLKQAAKTAERHAAVAALQSKSGDLQTVLQAGLAAQGRNEAVVVFGASAGAAAGVSAGAGAGAGLSTTAVSSFIPVDPPETAMLPELPADDGSDDGSADGAGARRRPSEPTTAYVQRRTRELNQRVRAHPRDESAWMALAAFQDAAILQGADRATARLSSRDNAVAEKRVAVLMQGLRTCPESSILRHTLLHTAAAVKPLAEVRGAGLPLLPPPPSFHLFVFAHQLDAMWTQALQACPGDASLWVEFMQRAASSYTTFSVDAMRRTAGGALSSLRALLNRDGSSLPTDVALGAPAHRYTCAMLDVFEEAVDVHLAAGFTERATAQWQALLEFVLDTPPAVADKPLVTRLKFFEAFWNSDYARIGDAETHTGWSTWLVLKMSGEDGRDQGDTVAADGWPGAAMPSEPAVWGALGEPEPTLAVCHGGGDEATSAGAGAGAGTGAGAGAATEPPSPPPTSRQMRMVYSSVHGHRIPLPVDDAGDGVDDGSTQLYQKILGELRDEGNAEARAAAKAARAAARTLKAQHVPEDDVLVTWLRREDSVSSRLWLPRRHGETDAPVRTVLASHVQQLLFDVPGPLLADAVLRALHHFGAHVLRRRSSAARRRHARLAAPPAWVAPPGSVGASWLPFCQTAEAAPSVALTFLTPALLRDSTRRQWLRNVVRRVAMHGALAANHHLQAVFIDVEAQLAAADGGTVDVARPWAKAVLARLQMTPDSPHHQAPECLLPWLSYALLEVRTGNAAAGARVLDKALALSAALPPSAAAYRFLLAFTASRLALAGDTGSGASTALHVLCSAVESPSRAYTPWAKAVKKLQRADATAAPAVVTPTRLLAARNAFQRTWAAEARRACAALQAAVVAWVGAPAGVAPPVFAVRPPPVDDQPPLLNTAAWLAPAGAAEAVVSAVCPLASLACCWALLEYLANGLKPAQAVFQRSTQLFHGLAQFLVAGASVANSRERPSACHTAVDAAAQRWLTGHDGAPAADVTDGGGASASVWCLTKRDADTGADDATLHRHAVDPSQPHGAVVDKLLANMEWLYEWWAELVHRHSATHALPPRTLRLLLETGLRAAPGNTFLFGLYTATESKTLVALRQAEFLDHLLAQPSCPQSVAVFALHAALTRAQWRTSAHRVRRLFETVLAAGGVAEQLPLAWRWYLRFELACGRPLAAKKVYLRALNVCPGSKHLWLDGVRRLRPYLPVEELRAYMQAMGHKGLAVRHGLV